MGRATDKRELSIGEDILDRLETRQRGMTLLKKAEAKRNFSAAVACIREVRFVLGTIYSVAQEAVPKHRARSTSRRSTQRWT
jgi:hypothetical protein